MILFNDQSKYPPLGVKRINKVNTKLVDDKLSNQLLQEVVTTKLQIFVTSALTDSDHHSFSANLTNRCNDSVFGQNGQNNDLILIVLLIHFT